MVSTDWWTPDTGYPRPIVLQKKAWPEGQAYKSARTHTSFREVYQAVPEAGLLASGYNRLPDLPIPTDRDSGYALSGTVRLTSYSGGTAPVFHRLPFSARLRRATFRLSSIVNGATLSHLRAGSNLTAIQWPVVCGGQTRFLPGPRIGPENLRTPSVYPSVVRCV